MSRSGERHRTPRWWRILVLELDKKLDGAPNGAGALRALLYCCLLVGGGARAHPKQHAAARKLRRGTRPDPRSACAQNSVLAAPTPPTATAAAAIAAPSPPVATVNPAAANAAMVAARLVPSTRTCHTSVSLTTGSRGVAGSSAPAADLAAYVRRERDGQESSTRTGRSHCFVVPIRRPRAFPHRRRRPQPREVPVAP